MSLQSFIDRAFWALLLGVAAFGVKFLGDMSQSVTRLNEQVAVILLRLETLEHRYNDTLSGKH